MRPSLFCLVSSLFLLFAINSGSTFAQDTNIYVVNDVLANATGKSPTEARISATISAQKNAFLILLERLAIDEKIISNLQNDEIADMVSSQQIMNEKIAGNQYSASFNITFSESFVKHYLNKNTNSNPNQNNIEPKHTISKNLYLILPIKKVQDKSLIWEDSNNWKIAMENSLVNFLKENPTASFKMPKGDVEDISSLNLETINIGNFTNFEPIFNKYQVDGLILVYFDFDSLENKVNITLKTIQKFHTDQVKLSFTNVNQLSVDNLIAKVADKTLAYIISRNNKADSETTTSTDSYPIDVMVADLNNWLVIKNKIQNSNLVSQLKVKSISRDIVKINVTYSNSSGDIISAFAKNNLFLHKKNEGGYILSAN